MALVHPQVSLPARPLLGEAVVTLPAVTPGNLTLSAPAVTCPLGACVNSTWATTCTVNPGGGAGPSLTRLGAAITASIGYGTGNDINLTPGTDYTCSAQQSVADVLGRITTGTAATFRVRQGFRALAASGHCSTRCMH